VLIDNAIQNGQYGLQRVLKNCNVKILTLLDESVLKNANTPGDLEPNESLD